MGRRGPTEEREGVTKVARQLLPKLRSLLALDWRLRIASRAKVRMAIEDALDELPRAYTKELYEAKVGTVFEHVFESYRGDGASVFTDAAV